MENSKIYRCKSDIGLSQITDQKEDHWKRSTQTKNYLRKFLPTALASKYIEPKPSIALTSSSLLPTFSNNDYSNIKLLTHEGDLWLKESSLLKTSWRKKHFILLEDKLHCYEIKKGVLIYSGVALRMSDVATLALEDTNCIKVCNRDGSTRLLRCKSMEERNVWLTALLGAKAVDWLR